MSLIKHVSCFHIHQIDFPVLLQNFNRNYYWKIKQYRWKIFIQLGVSKMFDGEIIIIYKHFSMYIINEMCMNLLTIFQKTFEYKIRSMCRLPSLEGMCPSAKFIYSI